MRRIREVIGGVSSERLTRRALLLAMLCTVAFGSACRGNTEEAEAAEPVPPTWIVIRNQAFLDMNIYVYKSTQRIRLGMVGGNSTGKLLIPANYLFGSTPLRFQADPIGGGRKPVTQEISVSPGDEINMTIPPS
ncbi:MAG: hypothetical protein ABJE47_01830 [bacterium]